MTDLVDSRDTPLLPLPLRPIGALVQPLYVAYVRRKARLHASGKTSPSVLPRPIVSVGNIVVGGSGKTPFVIKVCSLLVALGMKPGILTRGYKRLSKTSHEVVCDGQRLLRDVDQAGDEAVVLARATGFLPLAVGRNRYRAGLDLLESCDVDVFVLDDGFQHAQLRRTVDLVLVDATHPFDRGRLFPVGRLREPPEALGRADAVILSRAHQVEDVGALIQEVEQHCPGTPVLSSSHEVVGVRALGGVRVGEPGILMDRPVFALAAIGSPQVFLNDLKLVGARVLGQHFPRDHHWYTQDELDGVVARAAQLGCEAIVVTGKDFVKLERLNSPEGLIHELQIRVDVDGEDELTRLLESSLAAQAES